MLFLHSEQATFSLGGTNFIELFDISRYISLKLFNYRQGVCMWLTPRKKIVPSAKVSGRLSLFRGYPVFALRASLAGEN